MLNVRLIADSGSRDRSLVLDQVVVASWTARDKSSMEGRLAELEALGIPRPPSLPVFYRIAASRATTSSRIEVMGNRTTGEAEFVLLKTEGRVWVGVGSDHTDRTIEAQDAGMSKQVCDKPIGAKFWALDDLLEHWDSLRMRSFVTGSDGTREAYQDGSVATMLAPLDLLELLGEVDGAAGNLLLFCGTLPTFGGIRPAVRFECELVDERRNRALAHVYDVTTLPPFLAAKPRH